MVEAQMASPSQEHGLEVTVKRLAAMKENVFGLTGDLQSKISYLVGSVEGEKVTSCPEAVPSGVLGELEQGVNALETALAPLNSVVGELVTHMNVVYWIRAEGSAEWCDLSARTVRKLYPAAHLYAMTEEIHEDLDGSVHQIVNRDLAKYPKMVANVMAQTRFLLSKDFNTRTAFLDVDVLLVNPLPHFDSDLAITWRAAGPKASEELKALYNRMPYNYGVILCNPTSGAKEAMLWLRKRLFERNPQLQDWYGNQWALRELAGPLPRKHGPEDIFSDYRMTDTGEEVCFMKFPCHVYNYTPESPQEKGLKDKVVVHVKGDRKEMMLPIGERLGIL